MCVPEEVGSRLSEMIHFEARLVAALSEMIRFKIVGVACGIAGIIANFQLWWPLGAIYFGKAGITSVRSLVSLPIPIIRDLSCWRR